MKSSTKKMLQRYLTIVLACSFLFTLPATPTAFAHHQYLRWNEEGISFKTFEANNTIQIFEGAIEFIGDCEKGTKDFVYPYADVFIVPAGSVTLGSSLVDVGNSPNTVQGLSGGIFAYATLGYTAPSGKINAGKYAIVYDECQDGELDAADKLFDPAFEVVIAPGNIPPLPGIAQLKLDAKQQADSMFGAYALLRTLFFVLDGRSYYSLTKNLLFESPYKTFFTLLTKTYEVMLGVSAKEAALTHTFNTFKHYLAIANDPPDPNFQQVSPLNVRETLDAESGDPVVQSLAHWGSVTGNEGALAQALLASMERYQGADAANNGTWALIHARAIKTNATQLAAQLARSNAAHSALSAALLNDTRPMDDDAVKMEAIRNQIVTTGFTTDDLREARNLGISDAQLDQLRTDMASQSFVFTKADLIGTLQSLQNNSASLKTSLETFATDMDAIITTLTADPGVVDDAPTVNVGGPYIGTVGQALSFNGAASTSSSRITSYAWDLDGDGAFDDASGATPSFTYNRAFGGWIGLRVTNADGKSNIGYAVADVTSTNRAPTINTFTPEGLHLEVIEGTPQAFSVTTSDSDGDSVGVHWLVDGTDTTAGSTFTFSPSATQVGFHFIEAVANDNNGPGGQVRLRWAALVLRPDADGDGWRKNADCDDSDASVNPGKTEVLRNGKDDDCNPDTSDDGAAPSAAFTTAKAVNRAQLEDGAAIVGYSSVYNTQTVFRAENAIDSSVDTFWQTASSQPNNQHITIKVAGSGPQVVSQVVLRGSGAETDVKNFRVLVSTTGTTDADFHQVFNGTKPRDINVHSFNFAPAAAKYVRFVVVDNYGGSHTVVNDVDIRTRGHEGGIVSLREGPAASIAAYSSQDSTNYKAEHLLDDSSFTAWYTSYGQSPANQWVKVKLGGGKTYTINRVRLQGGGHWHEVKDFEIRVSSTTTDNAAFTTVFSGTRLSNSELQEFTFNPVAAKYVQLFVKSNYGRSDYLGLTMFQVITPEGVNAARLGGVGAAVVATSSPPAWATAPELVIDYSPNGSWGSTGEPKNQWLKLALLPGGPHLIDRVKLQTEGGNNAAKDFEIRVSNATAADADFKTVVLTGTIAKDKHEHWFTFPPTEAKLVQVFLHNNYGDPSSIQLSNVQVYSPNMGGPTVSFDDHSTDPDNTITGWEWAFGDGTTSTERHPTHTYATPGTYTVSLTVTADDGRGATTTMPYTVLRSPTVEDFTLSPTQLKEDSSTVTLDATASSDVASLVDWRWQLPFEADEKTGKSITSYFADSGELPVTLTVIDSQLLQRKLTKTVNVENLAPTVNVGPDKQVVWGQAWNTNIWKNAVTQSMEVSDPSSRDRTTLNCTWNFGDGQTSTIQPCTSDSSRITHTYATPGTYTATLTATDKDGASASDTLVATVDRRKLAIVMLREQMTVSNGAVAVNATVVDEFDPQASLVGKSIQWSSGVETKTALVGTGNKVSVQLTLPATTNPTVTATFAGDSLYHPSRAGRALGETAGVRDSQGTDFWLMFNTNNNNSVGQELSLFVTGTKDTVGTVRIPGLAFTHSFTVTAGQVTTIPIPPTAASNNNVEAKAIHLESLDEVSVYGLNRIKSTTDAFMGLPVDALGTEYLVLGYGGWGSELGVVATENDTMVSLTFPQSPNYAPFTVKLNQGQIYQFSNLPEVSGTSITSNKPISVFGGHACTQIPVNVPACDHVIEQIPPIETWGREFVTVPLATRKNGDTFRFLASRDGTTVSVNGSVVATLKRGQVHERIINGSSRIVASEPILVAQYANGQDFDSVIADPFMMLIPPYEQFQRSYTVTTPATGFAKNFVNVVAPQSALGGIKLDGALIPATQFAQIAGSDYYGAQIAVTSGSHTLSASMPFGIHMYGFDAFDSYGYPGGASQAPVASVSKVTLTPASTTKAVGTQHCVTATVTDAQGQGLEDVRVDFRVTGSNAGTGFVTTNATGQAQYCYTGTNVGSDSIVASVSTSSATTSATWLSANTPPVSEEQTLVTSEDTVLSVTLAASDAQNNTLTYTIVTQPQHGVLSGTAPSLIYTPASNFNGVDSFTFKANDGTADSSIATISITVQPVNDAPIADVKGPYTVDEGGAVEVEVTGSDADGDALSYAWDFDGDGTFEHIGANAIFSAQAIDGPATRSITVHVTDDGGLTSTAQTSVNIVNVAPTAELSNDGPVTEGGEVTISFSNQVDPSGADNNAGLRYAFACNGASLRSATWATSSETASITCTFDDGLATYEVHARVIDTDGGYTDYTTDVQVLNAPPIVGSIVAPMDPVKVNSVINVESTFSDAGILDTHEAVWDWGDGNTTVTNLSTHGVVSGSHSYTTAGVYAITLTVTDNDGGVGTQQFQYVVVYDPEGGFVTGGGRIESPKGAYSANPELTGKASFGFVSKYQKGANVPTGQTEFQFQMAGLNFHSNVYEWLVVSGSKAQYKGSGTINGQGDYGFLVTATDGQVSGGGGVDKFRIKIWDKASGTIVYDNQIGETDDAAPRQVIEGGSIVIHSK